jgi:hypothetical protein
MPDLLRARGLKVGLKRLQGALHIGVILGTYDHRHWVLTAEDVDAAERYFRESSAPGAQKGGAAGLEQARGLSPLEAVMDL